MLSRRALLRSARAAGPSRTLAAESLTRSQSRCYAAAAAQSDNIKLPVAVFGLDGTYATALYTAAAKTSSLEPTAKAISYLSALFNRDAKLSNILHIPTLSAGDRSEIVAELQKQAGASNETVKNFLSTLAENNRLGILKGVCDKFGMLMSASRGEVEMVVTSATPLDNKTLNRLETAVSKSSYVGQGKKLKVTNKINPDIVGGLVVEIDDRTIDVSVSGKVAKINKLLRDTV